MRIHQLYSSVEICFSTEDLFSALPHPNFCSLYNVLVGCRMTSHYYTLSPENELKTAKLYLLGLRVSIKGSVGF